MRDRPPGDPMINRPRRRGYWPALVEFEEIAHARAHDFGMRLVRLTYAGHGEVTIYVEDGMQPHACAPTSNVLEDYAHELGRFMPGGIALVVRTEEQPEPALTMREADELDVALARLEAR
jgi:hypothetical protein